VAGDFWRNTNWVVGMAVTGYWRNHDLWWVFSASSIDTC